MARKRKTVTRTEDNQPDWILKMGPKGSKKSPSAPIGVGWSNRAGGISIKLSRGMVLSWRDFEDYFVTLWPIDDDDEGYEYEEEIEY